LKRIFIYDTTLRDGAQGPGISFTVEDKLKIIRKLDVSAYRISKPPIG
jgi:2-isopropylmalate synthase